MNDYVNKNGGTKEVFLITQYFINGYLKKEDYPNFNADLSDVRKGVKYSIDLKERWTHKDGRVYTGTLSVNGRKYQLLIGQEKQYEMYDKAKEVFK